MNKPQHYLRSSDSFNLSCEPQGLGPTGSPISRGFTTVAYPAVWWFEEIFEHGIAPILNRFESDNPGDMRPMC